MILNYTSKTSYIVILAGLMCLPFFSLGQAPRVFTASDFELTGKVKFCEVITDYGKESFEFNEEGILTKSVTRYNDQDYDVTYYKYQGKELLERRNEVYRDGAFDKSTSIAHLYKIDTLATKVITEKIVSYNEEFLDNYEFHFDLEDRLVKVLRSNNDGLDETEIKYTSYKGENTVTHYLNGVILKSVRTSFKKKRGGEKEKIELTKDFLKGLPVKATEQIYDSENKLITQQNFSYDTSKKSFTADEKINFQYNENGMLIAKLTEKDENTAEQEYIYQYDNGDSGNWVKKIITPENAFTTRKITYYEEVIAKEE